MDQHDFTTTEEVNFACAQLTEVPIKLYENIWINIRSLNLDHNFLIRIPSVLFHSVPQIRKLRLAHNYLESLPASISECIQLEVLQLEHNSLVIIPNELKLLTKLQRVNLHYNALEVNDALVDIALSLPSVKVFTLSANPIPRSLMKIIEWKCDHNADFKKSPG
jgi:Leucine-rich repeat (LRR) protein